MQKANDLKKKKKENQRGNPRWSNASPRRDSNQISSLHLNLFLEPQFLPQCFWLGIWGTSLLIYSLTHVLFTYFPWCEGWIINLFRFAHTNKEFERENKENGNLYANLFFFIGKVFSLKAKRQRKEYTRSIPRYKEVKHQRANKPHP